MPPFLIHLEICYVGHAIKKNFIFSFPCIFSAFFITIAIFVSRFCFSPSLCSYPRIFIQTFTASAVRQNTCNPKVCLHTLSSHHTLTLASTHSSLLHLCLSAPSRSLQSIDEEGGVPPHLLHSISRGFEALRSLAKNIWAWAELSTAALPSSLHQDHSHENDYWSHYRKKM